MSHSVGLGLPALLLALCAAALGADVPLGAGDQATRGLLLGGECENTVSGRWFITDDRGYVCPRDTFNYQTGCCDSGQLHSCETCEVEDKCCSQFEHCVSCCLKPENTPEAHMHSIYRGRNKPETGRWSTPFQYCRAACRTTARSTQHENAFILDRKHCFSKLGRPRVPVPPAPPLPAGVSLLTGGPGQSCDAACAAKQLSCSAGAFASINDCNSLRSKFMCEAGCGPSGADQKEFPGYVEGSAPKSQRPAYCSPLAPPRLGASPAFDCSHASSGVRRLCPCLGVPGTQQSGQIDAHAAGGAADAAASELQADATAQASTTQR